MTRKRLMLSALCAGIALSACTDFSDKPLWGVYFSGLPEKIKTGLANEDAVYYILKQTHEPVFRKDDGQNYTSRILANWSRDVNSKEYEFCLKRGLEFRKDKPLTADIFFGHLSAITAKLPVKSNLSIQGDCAAVRFEKRQTGYLEYLTRYENAPTLTESEAQELGLGPYYIAEISKERIVLERKEQARSGYNSIVMYEYGGPSDLRGYRANSVRDFNRIPENEIPREIAGAYVSFPNISLKSVSLIVNIEDRALRHAVYNCIAPKELRAAFFPDGKSFYDIQTVLPLGVPGALAGKPEQTCGKLPPGKGEAPEIVFVNWRDNNTEQLQKFAAGFYEKSGIRLRIKKYTAYDLVKELFVRPHAYHLVMVATSVVHPHHDVFFRDILGSFVDFDLPALSALFNRMTNEENMQEKTDLAVKIARGLSREAVALPLYQEVRDFYYPPEVSNMVVGKSFIEYPEIADFRW